MREVNLIQKPFQQEKYSLNFGYERNMVKETDLTIASLVRLLNIDKKLDLTLIDFINKNRIRGKVSIIFFLIVQNNIELLSQVLLCAGLEFRIIDEVDYQGRGVIHIAAICGHNEVIRFLIKIGNNVRLQDKSGNTALDYAKKH